MTRPTSSCPLIYPRQPQYDIRLILQAIKEPVAKRAVAYLRQHAPQWLPSW